MAILKYKSKYSTIFKCENCGYENKIPCNFCEKCGKKLFENKCLHCWKSSRKVVSSTAESCDACNINKLAPEGRYK
jgi:hypothetical protein